jgi:hypothetical protein
MYAFDKSNITPNRRKIEAIGDNFAAVAKILKDIEPHAEILPTLCKGFSQIHYGNFTEIPPELVTLLDSVARWVFRVGITNDKDGNADIAGMIYRKYKFVPKGPFDKEFEKITDKNGIIYANSTEGT